jgi:hypothetical protein
MPLSFYFLAFVQNFAPKKKATIFLGQLMPLAPCLVYTISPQQGSARMICDGNLSRGTTQGLMRVSYMYLHNNLCQVYVLA